MLSAKTKRKQREYYERNKPAIAKYRRSWAQKNPDRVLSSLLLHKFGITLVEYNALLKQQGGVCAICQRPETARDQRWKKVKKLAVDHCHNNKHVRGLLCSACNNGLGMFRDKPEVVIEAAYYLLERGK